MTSKRIETILRKGFDDYRELVNPLVALRAELSGEPAKVVRTDGGRLVDDRGPHHRRLPRHAGLRASKPGRHPGGARAAGLRFTVVVPVAREPLRGQPGAPSVRARERRPRTHRRRRSGWLLERLLRQLGQRGRRGRAEAGARRHRTSAGAVARRRLPRLHDGQLRADGARSLSRSVRAAPARRRQHPVRRRRRARARRWPPATSPPWWSSRSSSRAA